MLTPTARDPGRRFTAADARTLAGLGFNVVRLGIIWEGLEPGPAGIGPNDPRFCAEHRAGAPFPALGAADPYRAATVRAYLARTDRIIRLLSRAGIRVIIDMHQDAWGSAFSDASSPAPWNGEGAPAWATCTDGKPFAPPADWAAAYGSPAVATAIHHFWANNVRGDLQGQFARVWRAVARYFRGDTSVVGYEIFNEPVDLSSLSFDRELQCAYGGPAREPVSCSVSGAQALRDGLIGAIKSADPRHVVFYEPGVLTDFGTPETIGIAEPLRFRGVALAFHLYSPTPAELLARITSERRRTRTEQPGGPPAIMDEFGADTATALTSTTVSLADRAGLSWTYWAGLQLHDPTGNPFEALLDQRTRRPYHAKALALAVPYPAATAGRPGAQSFDPVTGAFRYRYAVAPGIRALTEIVLPRDAYPRGYRVRVRGATVVSARGARLLELRALGRARRVDVAVRPA